MSPPSEKNPLYILSSNGIKVNLHVAPGASRSEFSGTLGNRLKLRLCAKAVDGQANRALCEFLADHFDVPKSSVSIERGIASREKTVLICGDKDALVSRLNNIL